MFRFPDNVIKCCRWHVRTKGVRTVIRLKSKLYYLNIFYLLHHSNLAYNLQKAAYPKFVRNIKNLCVRFFYTRIKRIIILVQQKTQFFQFLRVLLDILTAEILLILMLISWIPNEGE